MPAKPLNEYRDPKGLKNVLARLVAGARERVGASYVGAYLQGSLTIGHFDDASDVDFLIVVERELSAEVVERLQDFHRALYQHPSHWAHHLEGSYVPRGALSDLPPPRRELPRRLQPSATLAMRADEHALEETKSFILYVLEAHT